MSGLEIKEKRKRLKITQEDLAVRIGVSPQTIKNYEKGTIKPASKKTILYGFLNSEIPPDVTNLTNYKDVESQILIVSEPEANYNAAEIKINYDGVGVPIYDVGFTAGFLEVFKDRKPDLLGFLNTPEVIGSDMIIRANGQSMKGIIDDGDWVGLKRITDFEVISYGSPYGIVTKDLQLLKYLHKSKIKNNLLLKSENKDFEEFDLPTTKILELYIIKVVLPYSKVRTFI